MGKRSWFEWLDTRMSFVERVAALISVLGVGTVSAWAASVTEALRQYAPFSYVAAGLLGAGIIAFILAAFGWFLQRLATARLLRSRAIPHGFVNPLQKTFDGVRLHVSELADPVTNVVHGKTFTDCDLVGAPEAAIFGGCSFHDGMQLFECCGIDIGEERPIPTKNHAIFVQCLFRRCRFFSITMIMTKQSGEDFDAIFKGTFIWLAGRN